MTMLMSSYRVHCKTELSRVGMNEINQCLTWQTGLQTFLRTVH